MAYEAHTLTFDEARRVTSVRRGSVASSPRSRRAQTQPSSGRPARKSVTEQRASSRRGAASASLERPSARKVAQERPSQRRTRDYARSSSVRENGSDEGSRSERKSVRALAASLKQERAKSRAERKYNRQFQGERSARAAASEEAGPRAAVYRAEMGTQHRRATRLQDEGTASAAPKRKKSYSSVTHHPVFIVLTAVVACVVFACVFLYSPAQQYYLTLRQHDQLVAEYEAVLERNDALQDQLSSLSTEEGLKQYIHDKYGWVSEGENAVVVQGLNDGSENGLSDVAANVVPGSVKAPDTWYSDVLDPFFGYDQ